MTPAELALLGAVCSAASAALAAVGWALIRSERKLAHAVCMALATLTWVAVIGCGAVNGMRWFAAVWLDGGHLPDPASGWFKAVFSLTHLALAVVTMFFVIATGVPALQACWRAHRRIGRWATPLWLGAAILGTVVYGLILSGIF